MSAPLVPVRAPLVICTLAFSLGILLGSRGCYPAAAAVGLGTLLAWAARRWSTASRRGLILVCGLWLGAGCLRAIVWHAHPGTRLLAAQLPERPQPVSVHGVVLDDPVELFDPDEPGLQSCVIEVRHVSIDDQWRVLPGRLRVSAAKPTSLAYGDEVLLDGEWFRVPEPGNPGQYNWRAALARGRLHGLLRVRSFDGVAILQRHQGLPWCAAVFRVRERWARLIREAFGPRDAGLLLSLLLGQRVALEDQLKRAFVETGTVHLLVISGFNVGLIAGLFELFGRLLGLPWRIRLLLSAIGVGGYCLLTGMQPPVMRATIVAWMVFGAFALDRVLSWLNALAAAALLILWINPTQLVDPGFQLSFGAVLSLLLMTPRWHPWLDAHAGWIRPSWLRRYVTLSLTATAAVWAGLSPVLAWYFHLVSPVSMLANVLVAPLMSALVLLGTALLMLGTACDAIVRATSGILTVLLRITVGCVAWCHALPGGYWFVGQPSWAFLIGYYALLGLSMLRRRLAMTTRGLLVCWVMGLALWGSSVVVTRALEARWLQMDVLDVGHGDGIVVRLPGGPTFLVDAGSREAGCYRVIPFLRVKGITVLDAIVITHTDEDHLGGALSVMQEVPVKALLVNGAPDDTDSARALTRLAAAKGVPVRVLARGTRLAGASAVRVDVLHPPRGLVPETAPESNDNSLVLKLTMGRVSVLLTGDIDEAGLPWLLATGQVRGVTILKVPHHGSRLGEMGARFFQVAAPRVAIISVGHAHHLPAAETLQAIQQSGAILLSTREDGAVHLRTDGQRLELRTFRH